MSENIGWLFYRDYYRKALTLEQKSESEQMTYFNNDSKKNKRENELGKNDKIKDLTLPNASITGLLNLPERNKMFVLETTYPGMLIGTGYTHETSMMGEIKIGFFFDHTTGLPILPGSSVKGILRSVFPGKTSSPLTGSKMKFLQTLLHGIGVENYASINLEDLEAEVFDGLRNEKAVPLPLRDIFGDAYPSRGAMDNKLLGTDFITPHGNDLTKNPIPIQMLKVLPGVMFTFQFRLTDGLIGADAKCKLFKQILLQLGAGAKTNVGYGRFNNTEVADIVPNMYYTPSSNLSLLPNLPSKPQDTPLQRRVDFSDIVSATETLTRPTAKEPRDVSPLNENIWYEATVEKLDAQRLEITVAVQVSEGVWVRKTKKLNAKQFIKFQIGDTVRVKLLNLLQDHLLIEK